jgi:TctA family transporter
MLVLLNLPLIGIWVRLLTVPYRWLYPAILLFSCVGIYSLSNSSLDVILSALFGLLGYLFVKVGCEPAPFLLGFILGPLMEQNLRRALLLSRGDPSIFFTRPMSLAFMLAAAFMVLVLIAPAVRHRRSEAFQE